MTKKTLVSILLSLLTISATAQIKSEVSETVELMGILSRTAGFQEFSNDLAGQYSKDTEAWFAQYREHPTVTYYKELRAKNSIAYDRVTNMAVHLETEKGKVKLVGNRDELTGGWKDVDLDDFIKRLNKFYTDTRFHDFFEQHRTFYNDFLQAYDKNIIPIKPEWYGQFYNGAAPAEQFRIIIGFTYGTTNNGASRQLPGQAREVFAVCGYCINSQTGRPNFDSSLPLHEFNHSFVNPLLENADNEKTMQEAGQKLFQRSQSAMEQQHYDDWHIVINESLVRAAVIVYMYENGFKKFVANMLNVETTQNGFPWMLDVVSALRYYSTHREQYLTLNEFYPEIASILSKYNE